MLGDLRTDCCPVLDRHGRMLPSAHQWAKQLSADIKEFGNALESAAVEEAAEYPLLLFLDEYTKDTFLGGDPAILSAKFFTNAIPPPGPVGVQQALVGQPELAPEVEDRPHVCGLMTAEGTACTACFATSRSLKQHCLHSVAGGEHGHMYLSSVLTPMNLCVGCGAVHTRRDTTQHHLHS